MTNIVIELQRPYQAPTTHSFQDGTYIIGRESGDIVTNDPQVSGRHGELKVENGSVVYKDLGSTNGSYAAGGARIESPYAIPVNGVVRMGDCRLVLIKCEIADAYGKTMLQPAAARPAPQPIPQTAAPEGSPSPLVQAPPDQQAGDGQAQGATAATAGAGPAGGYFKDFIELLKSAFETLRPRK